MRHKRQALKEKLGDRRRGKGVVPRRKVGEEPSVRNIMGQEDSRTVPDGFRYAGECIRPSQGGPSDRPVDDWRAQVWLDHPQARRRDRSVWGPILCPQLSTVLTCVFHFYLIHHSSLLLTQF